MLCHCCRRQLYLPTQVLDEEGAEQQDLFSGNATPELCKAVERVAAAAKVSAPASCISVLSDVCGTRLSARIADCLQVGVLAGSDA